MRRISVRWRGKIIAFDLVEIAPGFELEAAAATAWTQIRLAAEIDGVTLAPRTAFRSFEWQTRLRASYEAYRDYLEDKAEWEKLGSQGSAPAKVPFAALAARPGSSAHECGRAVDVDHVMVPGSSVRAWLEANAEKHGWRNTVASEAWHWEPQGLPVLG